MISIASFLCAFYSALTAVKLLQWMVYKWGGGREHMYNPSLAVFMRITEFVLLGGENEPRKVPRGKFRKITDKWLRDYSRRVKNNDRKQKSFDSLKEALEDSFREFTQESSAFYVPIMHRTANDYINQPLGLCSMLAISGFVMIAPFLLLRELCLGGSALTVLCKVAASSTFNEIYVVCCKEELSFEQALHKYPWITGVFQKPQVHPMIGRAVCPVYQREVVMPKDKMNFDIELIPNSSGTMILQEVFSSRIQRWWNGFLPTQMVLLLLLLWYIMIVMEEEDSMVDTLVAVAPSAAVFYTARTIVDNQLGLHWASKHSYLP